MNPQQLAILNSLVTFAAENVPGGLSIEEAVIAKEVGAWALKGELVKQCPPLPVAKKDGKTIHYLHRGNIHQTLCGLPTAAMQRYFMIHKQSNRICTVCSGDVLQAAKL